MINKKTYFSFFIAVLSLLGGNRVNASDNFLYTDIKTPCDTVVPVKIEEKELLEHEENSGVIRIEAVRDQKVEAEDPNKNAEPVFTSVEEMPSFVGGQSEMYKFISETLVYPDFAKESGIQGRVTVRFIVSKTGEIENVTVVRGIDSSCDKEAVRMVQSMPKWIPGKQNGKNVRTYYTLPVIFRISK